MTCIRKNAKKKAKMKPTEKFSNHKLKFHKLITDLRKVCIAFTEYSEAGKIVTIQKSLGKKISSRSKTK